MVAPQILSLHDDFSNKFVAPQIERLELPAHISSNLNPKFNIRPYQASAFKRFLYYCENDFEGKPRQNHQLLFHMATGSGKTLMMAGLILHLYSQGYRNFLFFVNSSNIINKTRDNFLNALSAKYLFAENVMFGDKRVEIRDCENFQAANEDCINIVFSTIQGLHTALTKPRENALSFDDFEETKIVLISDEAHHINASTKKSKTQEDLFEVQSWEGTVERIFKANTDNMMLEFTATMDLSDENLAQKYKPKLIVDYPLREFRADGYSKEVKVLQASLSTIERAVLAIVLSQYRLKLFAKYQKTIKPVVMFKSKIIKDSQAFQAEFEQFIHGLTADKLSKILSVNEATVRLAAQFFEANNINLANLCIELKHDFASEKCLSVNSKEESEAKQLAVNSLEDANNEYRAVFAVDKLNEGWDVLNLFDIVRLYNTRDSKNNKVGKTTMSEAQLIGRGARYCPFQLAADQAADMRKFDADIENELRICEELYYHSETNSKYIQELNVALVQTGMKAPQTVERQLKLKELFKQTELYNHGHIFLNTQKKYLREDVFGLSETITGHIYKIKLRTGDINTTQMFVYAVESRGIATQSKDFKLLDFGEKIVRKAMQKLPFYAFDTLKKHFPHLTSSTDFITNASYLADIKLEITGRLEHISNLTADDKLLAATQVLEDIQNSITADKVEFKGTQAFIPKTIKSVFSDKTLNFAMDTGGDREFGRSMSNAIETSIHLDLSHKDWYVFDDCFGTSEEKLLIKFIDKRYDDLKLKFSEAYLIRNEKHFKLYSFDDGRALEPDFLLYLIGKNGTDTMHYQVFIEPKGGHLIKADEWKQQFLLRIKDEFTVDKLFTNKNYTVWGLPFYNQALEANFSNSFNEVLA